MVDLSLEQAEQIYHDGRVTLLEATARVLAAWPGSDCFRRALIWTSDQPSCRCAYWINHPEFGPPIKVETHLWAPEIRAILGGDFEAFDTFCRHFELYSDDFRSIDRIRWPRYRDAWNDRENFAFTLWSERQADQQRAREEFDARALTGDGAFCNDKESLPAFLPDSPAYFV